MIKSHCNWIMPGIIGKIEDIFQRPLCWPDRGRKDSIKVFICQMFFLRKYNCKMAFRNIGEKGSIHCLSNLLLFSKSWNGKNDLFFTPWNRSLHYNWKHCLTLNGQNCKAKHIFLIEWKRIIAKTSYFTLPIVSQFYRLVK